MREIEIEIFNIKDNVTVLKEGIKRLVNEPEFNPLKIIELCVAMSTIRTAAVILDEVVEKEKVKTASGYN